MGASRHTQRRLDQEPADVEPPATEGFRLVLMGAAHGQQRTGGNGRIRFTPPGTRAHAQRVQTEWIAQGRPTVPAGTYYQLHVESLRARPASHLNTKGAVNAAGRRTPYPGKPDLDNEIKAILDCLVACGAIPDDRFCHELHAWKRWLPPGVHEHVVVHVYPTVVPW